MSSRVQKVQNYNAGINIIIETQSSRWDGDQENQVNQSVVRPEQPIPKPPLYAIQWIPNNKPKQRSNSCIKLLVIKI